jgi:formate dehydrogenase subunit gamma
MDTSSQERQAVLYIPRYTAFQRINHWITAVLFILLALSGLGMAYPPLFFLTGLFGGGEAARAIHPWLGVALVVSFFLLAVRLIDVNLINNDDIVWIKKIRQVLRNQDEGLPEFGRYNAGQKGVYWSQLILIAILFFSGLPIWQVYFGASTSIPLQRFAVLIHSLAAFVAIAIIIIHIYAAFWAKGTMRAMTRGSVTGGWAYTHHRKWLREVLAREAEAKGNVGGARTTERQ